MTNDNTVIDNRQWCEWTERDNVTFAVIKSINIDNFVRKRNEILINCLTITHTYTRIHTQTHTLPQRIFMRLFHHLTEINLESKHYGKSKWMTFYAALWLWNNTAMKMKWARMWRVRIILILMALVCCKIASKNCCSRKWNVLYVVYRLLTICVCVSNP